MTRHVVDHAQPTQDPAHLERALAMSRKFGDAGLHPTVRALTRRYIAVPNDKTRLTEFLRIVRGRLT